MFEIPGDGLGDAGIEGLLRFPAQFALDLACVDGIAPVMSGAVRDVGNLCRIGLAVGSGPQGVQTLTYQFDYIDVGFFVSAADVVGLAHPARFQHAPDGAAMILDVEPVANLHAVTVDR